MSAINQVVLPDLSLVGIYDDPGMASLLGSSPFINYGGILYPRTDVLSQVANAGVQNAYSSSALLPDPGTSASSDFGQGAVASGNLSVAFGPNSSARDASSVAVGYGSQATRTYAVALGAQSNAFGYGAVALGYTSNVGGAYSIAVGRKTYIPASSPNSVVIGDGSSIAASSAFSVVVGQASSAIAANATVVGQGSKASGMNDVIIGCGSFTGTGGGNTTIGCGTTTATGNTANNVVVGYLAAATGGNSVCIGENASAGGASTTAVGQQASAPGINGTAIGQQAVSGAGTGNTVVGRLATTNTGNTNSVAIGVSANASDSNTVAIGASCAVSGAASVAVGQANTVTHTGCIVLGQAYTSAANNEIVFKSGAYTLKMPTTGGTANFAMTTDGTGIASWVTGQSIAGLTTASSPQFAGLALGIAMDAVSLLRVHLALDRNIGFTFANSVAEIAALNDANGAYVPLYVGGSTTYLSVKSAGNVVIGAATSSISFFNGTPNTQQASGANLTNSVSSGGSNDTIADFTSLTVYATDAGTIRNDIYQLARKLKQVNDALRLYGLLT